MVIRYLTVIVVNALEQTQTEGTIARKRVCVSRLLVAAFLVRLLDRNFRRSFVGRRRLRGVSSLTTLDVRLFMRDIRWSLSGAVTTFRRLPT